MFLEVPCLYPKDTTEKEESYQSVLNEIGVSNEFDSDDFDEDFVTFNIKQISSFNPSGKSNKRTSFWINGLYEQSYLVNLEYSEFKRLIEEAYNTHVLLSGG